MKSLPLAKVASIAILFFLATAVMQAQTFETIAQFDGANGEFPLYGSLIQGLDGNFWGTTELGGAGVEQGTVFNTTSQGKITVFYSFCPVPKGCTTGTVPYWGLVQDTAGNFFGTTYSGGTAGEGTLYKLNPQAELTTIYSFCNDCGGPGYPYGALIPVTSEDFVGSANFVIYDVTPSGRFSYTKLNRADYLFPLFQATDGSLWGRGLGKYQNAGSIAVITPKGGYKTLYNFCSEPTCLDGSGAAFLMQGSDGNVYGETASGGVHGDGVFFKFTASGQYSVVYNFCCVGGAIYNGNLIQGTDGNFYGTTAFGGVGYGTVFQLTPAGQQSTLHTFCENGGLCADGAYPLAGLVQGTDGNFYGTTSDLGPSLDQCPPSCGTVFKISMGLAPFVKANPNFGKNEAIVNILGNNVSGTTSVAFNGVSAKFKVVSDTYIKAQVPTGATSGTITVTTPSGTLKSNVAFQVLP